MTDITTSQSLGAARHRLRSSWLWFIALGVGFLIAGGVASLNLMAATMVSILYIGAMMVAGAVLALFQTFSVASWQQKLLHGLAAIVYGLAGVIVLHDPVLASLSLSLTFGLLLCVTGGLRIGAGISARHTPGGGWIIAAGIFTVVTGGLVIAAWPGVGLWLLGAILTVDLIFQGWGFVALGIAIRPKGRSQPHPAEGSPTAHVLATVPPPAPR